VRVIPEAKLEAEQIDARVLAELLARDYPPAIWIRRRTLAAARGVECDQRLV
jgi:hypothetical protein